MSRQAVTDFQTDHGLTPDGEPGKQTQAALRQAVAEEPEADPDFWQDIRWFSREEFRCKCGGRYCTGFPRKMRQQAVQIADGARAYFGRPAHVVSGLRCRQWNLLQGGVENSQHQWGEAVDLRIDGVTAEQLLAFLQTVPAVRYAYAITDTNVHFDIPAEMR